MDNSASIGFILFLIIVVAYLLGANFEKDRRNTYLEQTTQTYSE